METSKPALKPSLYTKVAQIHILVDQLSSYVDSDCKKFKDSFWTDYSLYTKTLYDPNQYELVNFKSEYDFTDYVDALLHLLLSLHENLKKYLSTSQTGEPERNLRILMQILEGKWFGGLLRAFDREISNGALQTGPGFFFLTTTILASFWYFENLRIYKGYLESAQSSLVANGGSLQSYSKKYFEEYEISSDLLTSVCDIVSSDNVTNAYNKINNAFKESGDLQVSDSETRKEMLEIINRMKGKTFLVGPAEFAGFTDFHGNIYINDELKSQQAHLLVTILHELAHVKRIMSAPNKCPFYRTPDNLRNEAGDFLEIEVIGDIVHDKNISKYSNILSDTKNWTSNCVKSKVLELKTEMASQNVANIHNMKQRRSELRCLYASGIRRKLKF